MRAVRDKGRIRLLFLAQNTMATFPIFLCSMQGMLAFWLFKRYRLVFHFASRRFIVVEKKGCRV
jgi:hypothetical protein